MEAISRLIANDEELLVVFKVLLSELKERTKGGKFIIFLPWKFVLPPERLEIKDKKKYFVEKTEEKIINFSFEAEEAEVNATEAMRLLGVTLYHLVTGKSEHTHESYLLDGYRRPLDSGLWPAISLLLKGETKEPEEVEKMIESVEPDDIKANIQPVPMVNVVTSKNRTADDVIRELANERIKIIGHEPVANMWGIVVPGDIQIRYNEASLRESIEANANGEQWALGYYSGQNPRQMRQKIGTGSTCFYNNDWWLAYKEDFWATKTNIKPGYYLLNFNGKFADKNWDTQERLIGELGPVYKRCHEFVVSETVLSNYRIHNSERLLENWYHWGEEFGSDRNRVAVGRFGSSGFIVSDDTPSHSGDLLRVVVARKFDF